MSKAVSISIRPEWVRKILNGRKTIEVRKTRPKMNPPFKCYIYRSVQGGVIGEFICDRIYELETKAHGGSYYVKGENQPTTNDVARQSCLDLRDMHEYLQSKVGYGWHISNLRIYDTPRELEDFRRACKNDWWCESCAMYRENDETCGNGSLQIRRPPQSWCYVEEQI